MLYVTKRQILRWFESYFSNRRQFVTYDVKQENMKTIPNFC